ncbi:hypothetical protein NDU88_005569 [Pleurodeles waltl]|uniref:Uncharacterized protein n=1 Tax=Pleurodeles waltl TaxID=8319 RepID=A0AAV7SM66_PLEWA|nr:hypothetical protein NDU88_005569 [Pleurodeles waltl]
MHDSGSGSEGGSCFQVMLPRHSTNPEASGTGHISRTWRRGSAQQRKPAWPKDHSVTERQRQREGEPGTRSSLGAVRDPKTALHTNLHSDLRPSWAMPKRKYNTHRQGMGDCSPPQPKHPGGRPTNPSADREPEEAEPLPEQVAAQAQARQVRLEGRDSIVRFLRRTATVSPEWGREHVRSHATEEEADSRTIIEEQIPAHGMSSPDTSTDTDSPTEGSRAHRSLSCPALLTTGHHDSSVYNASLSQARTAPLPPLSSVISTTVDSTIQCYNSAVDCPPSAVSPQPSLYKDLFVTADTAN